jgi:sec-independent protein translocase protein TatA
MPPGANSGTGALPLAQVRFARGRGTLSRMPSIGPLELGILLLIVLIVFGPKRLPGLGRQLGSGMREFKESITGKDRDEEDDDEDRDAFGEPARRPARSELDRSSAETEVVTGETRREDQPASRRADT